MHFRRGVSVQGARGSGEVTWGLAAQGEVSLCGGPEGRVSGGGGVVLGEATEGLRSLRPEP